MKHNEYIRIIPGGRTAVLMIHGIVGTPRFFDGIIAAVPRNFSIYNILLDGHGGEVSDFTHTSMKKWENQVFEQVRRMSDEYENIIIMGHSMGTLLAAEATLLYPERIRRLIFFAVPLKMSLKISAGINAMKVILSIVNEKNPVELAAKNAYSIKPDKRLWKYLGWIPRYLELFWLIRRVRNEIADIKIPCHAFQSRRDEMVSAGAMQYIRKNPLFSGEFLEKSRHYYYDASDFEYIKECVEKILKTSEE